MSINQRASVPLSSLFLLLWLLLAAQGIHAQERDARSILKAMPDYVGSLQSIELTFDSAIEVITPHLE